MSRTKPAAIRFYVDADLLGLAHTLVAIRPDVTFPGDKGGVIHKKSRAPCLVTTTSIHDDVWIPLVTEQSWLIITKDRHIQTRYRERQAVKEHSARMVSLVGSEAIGTFAQLEIIMCQWRRIETALTEKGPFIYRASRTSFKPIDLG